MKGQGTGRRLTGVTGLAFAVIYFAYVVMLNPPDISVSSRDALEYWAESGNQARSVVDATLCGLAAVLLVGFAVGLAQRLDSGGAAASAHAVRIGGGITATLLLMGGALFAAPGLALALNNEPVPMNEELGLAIRASSFVAHPVMLWFAAIGASTVVAATTAGWTALGWRPWTVIVGSILALLLMAPIVFFGLMFFLLWMAAVSMWLLLSRAENRHGLRAPLASNETK